VLGRLGPALPENAAGPQRPRGLKSLTLRHHLNNQPAFCYSVGMNRRALIIIFVIVLAALGVIAYLITRPAGSPAIPFVSKFSISSPAFKDGEAIPAQFTCDGESLSPPLQFSNIPGRAETFAVLMEDVDANKNIKPAGAWTHWLVYNLPRTKTELAQQEIITTGLGLNDNGRRAYTGPCPPSGTHRYVFRLFAVNTTLSLKPTANRADFLQALGDHVVDEVQLIGLYQRP